MIDTYDILDSLSELVYVTDPQTHKILYINKAGKEALGNREGEVCYKVLLGRDEPCDKCLTENVSKDKFHEFVRKSDVNGRIYALRSKTVIWDNKTARLNIAFDITERESKRMDLEMRLDMEHFLVSCIIEMHKKKPYEETFNSLLGMMGRFLDADRVYIFNYNGVTMSNLYEWCREGVTAEINNLQSLDAHLIDRWMDNFRIGECVIIEDIETIKQVSPQEYEELSRQGVNRIIVAPLEDNGEIIGFIGIDNPPSEKIDKSELFFTTLGYFISSMLVKHENEKRLTKMSYTDILTGMNNRNKFINDSKVMSEQKNPTFGVVFMDLNGLKEINDKQGHDAGDEALKTISDIIVDIYGCEMAYRVGGDEFVVLCPKADENSFMENISRLNDRFAAIEYNTAIGYHYSNKPCEVDDIVKMADEMMYLDKKYFYRNQKQSSRYRFRTDTFAAISTPESLKKLIKEERFVIWFQPRFSVEDGKLSGSEALIRFFDEDEVLVSPMDFVPEMEDNETIHLIDLYVFKHVCEYISGWIKAGKKVKPISLNMSHQTMLRSNFIENIMDIWYDYNIPKELIIFEVSENREKGGIADVVDILANLKKRGFCIAIDNFGSKYADLYLFSDLKFDILKLDGDMVYKIETDKKAHILSNSIAQICHSENIRIVAEGVETEHELGLLRDMGCDEVQGYLFDKPMSWNRFEEKYLNE
jgi:diguanylate cyclase (GGDEF)-like protein